MSSLIPLFIFQRLRANKWSSDYNDLLSAFNHAKPTAIKVDLAARKIQYAANEVMVSK